MDGTDIKNHVLRDGNVSVSILSLGGITQDWRVDDIPVVLGFSDPADYLQFPGSMGVLVGRVANRIGNARYTLDGTTCQLTPNAGSNHQLHGGPVGWSRHNWRMEPEGHKAVRLFLQSPDGDMGFPGQVDVEVRISLDGHSLTYDMRATPDTATPINMANHNYYNLMGQGDIWDHQVQINASDYTAVDHDLIPTGGIPPVAGTRYDFTQPIAMRDADPNLKVTDVNFALDRTDSRPACQVTAPNGMSLQLWTDQPGLQLYSGHVLAPRGTPHPGQTHHPCTGLALEAQAFPDSVNHAHFPSVIHTPERPYRQVTRIRIAPSNP